MSKRTAIPEGAKAQRVYLTLREDISAGVYATGQTLPGEQKLASTFDVSRVTVRRALAALCEAGLIERRAGAGTVVCGQRSDDDRVAMDVNTLMPQLAEMSRATTARLLSFTYGDAPDKVAEAMGLADRERVQIATRVRLADGVPFSHLTTYVPEAIASHYSESDLADTPLFSLLERSGVSIGNARQTVTATLASPAVAEALDVSVGTALLSLQRIVCDSAGQGVEYLDARYRPDRFSLEMTLARVGDGAHRHWQPTIASTPEDTRERKRA
ncbi:MAG: GntR family transcriptional regulator [Pseudomonadota bacterium]